MQWLHTSQVNVAASEQTIRIWSIASNLKPASYIATRPPTPLHWQALQVNALAKYRWMWLWMRIRYDHHRHFSRQDRKVLPVHTNHTYRFPVHNTLLAKQLYFWPICTKVIGSIPEGEHKAHKYTCFARSALCTFMICIHWYSLLIRLWRLLEHLNC